MRNIETVKHIYEAFGRGDIPAIIAKLDQNVEWDVEDPTPGVPWLRSARGRQRPGALWEPCASVVRTLRAAHVERSAVERARH
jgi:ketosteroid isomerase-like protein